VVAAEPLEVRTIRLITNNPAKYSGLTGHALSRLERVSLPVATTPESVAGLRAERDGRGHLVNLPNCPETGS